MFNHGLMFHKQIINVGITLCPESQQVTKVRPLQQSMYGVNKLAAGANQSNKKLASKWTPAVCSFLFHI